jgi:hypothetical protein
MKNCSTAVFLTFMLAAHMAAAQQAGRTIFLVRHAERVSSATTAPLSPAGVKRSECLERTLQDSNIRQIFVSDVTATQETAAALANTLKIKPSVIAVRDTSTLVRNVLYSRSGNALVVADRDNLPVIIPRLQAGAAQPLGENEYDRLYVITLAEGSGMPAVVLHYCDFPQAGRAPHTTPYAKRVPKSIEKKR